jgi:uncharacterized membrane protein YdbT with pleckstrin-like domain
MEVADGKKQMVEHLQPSIVVILLRLIATIFMLDTLYALLVVGFFGLNNFHDWHNSYIYGLLLTHTVKYIFITAVVIKLFIDWASRAYYLSGHHLIEKIGLVNTTETTHELSQVKEVVVRRSWLGRRFNFGTIVLSLAGSAKSQDVIIRDINDPLEYKRYFDEHLQVQGWVR